MPAFLLAMDGFQPLILTLALDEASFAFFDAQRRRHFPPERNLIPAHLTLFHHLPGRETPTILQALTGTCRAQAPFSVEVTGLRSLGRGVAYTLRSVELAQLRRTLAERWSAWLTPQDRQKHQPHITVQNKASPEAARELLSTLQAGFDPFTVTGEGLHLWRYFGGPWEPVATIPFRLPRSPHA